MEVQNSVGFRIGRAFHRMSQEITTLLAPYGIAPEQRILLEMIASDAHANQTTLATLMDKSKTTISRTLRSLEAKGYIAKEAIHHDRRCNFIKLTPQGESILEETRDVVHGYREQLASRLTEEEKKQLFTLLEKVFPDTAQGASID